jgi:hypothetical protein
MPTETASTNDNSADESTPTETEISITVDP